MNMPRLFLLEGTETKIHGVDRTLKGVLLSK
jgi:hypothetical protein